MENRNEVNVTINRPAKVLYFSDGVEEIMEEKQVEQQESVPDSAETVDPTTLTWAPWFSHYAWKSGSSVLNAVDYAGESLASFFGITTPKYLLEIKEYERMQEEKKKMDDDAAGWVPKNAGGDVPLVLNEPLTMETNKEAQNRDDV